MDAYPITAWDNYKSQCEILEFMTRELLETCYQKCDMGGNFSNTTLMEGLCIRNCVNKFSALYPTLQRNLANSDYYYYEEKYRQES